MCAGPKAGGHKGNQYSWSAESADIAESDKAHFRASFLLSQ